MSLISVVVPVYNSSKYLSSCVSSILAQVLTSKELELELLLVNDGSTDDSLSICKTFEAKDNRVRVINKENGGVSSARNAGIAAALGDYIAFVDSDDTIGSSLYQEMWELIQVNKTECAVLLPYTVRNGDGRLSDNIGIISGHCALSMLADLQFPTSLWAYLYKREIISDQRLREDIHFFEDFEFNYWILERCSYVALCHKPLYNYRINANSINAQGANMKRLSCLAIPEAIHLGLKNCEVSSVFFEVYFIFCVISPLQIKSLRKNRNYIRVAQKHINDVWWRLVFLKDGPLIYKVLLGIAAIDLRLLVLVRGIIPSWIQKYKKLV